MATFRYLEEKLLECLQGWKQRTLSWAAKETLIKSIALALPLHVMSCFRLPLSMCRLLDRHVARFWWGVEEGHSRIRWVSWRNMCRSKHEGGMGFRRFEQFNQALLAKIGWQILSEPDSLLAKVYKGKYFPNGTFLSATARSRPSWGWQGVLYGRQLLERGLRWQIGNGRTASLLHSNWIPQVHPWPVRYNPRVLPAGGDPTVSEVISLDGGCWAEDKLGQWFEPVTCNAIKDIPLPRQNLEDKLIWHATADGVFSVKSAYHLAVSVERGIGRWRQLASWMDKPSWIRFWEANIPPKLKVFCWQIFNRVLPTTEALRERGVEVLPRCPVCWAESETMEHLFLDCPVAHALWDLSGLEHLGQGLPRHTFPLFLKRLMNIVNQAPLLMKVVAILWRIWRSRNWVVFEGKQYGIPVLMRQFHQQFEEWDSLAAVRLPNPCAPLMGHQSSGVHSRVSCRWDGATRAGSHSAGGMVIVDDKGATVWAAGIQFPHIDAPPVVELLALREAILWALRLGFTAMQFEGDAKVIIDKINRADASDSQMGVILQEVINLLAVHSGFCIRFVGRCNNRVAHLVARKALSLYPATCRSFDFQAWLSSRM
ncbi:unnamed protein product [Linum trigynum]|uniref:Reverse transcriptase zinc-binding domain-containing protein n=1 Tax=Linum trigynum TaxID=586398 RepID=A0AAV2GQ23_9ROSI